MMAKVGAFFFRYRNGLFPLAYILLLLDPIRMWRHDLVAALIGFLLALSGQILRALTIGLVYIVRGGKNRQVYAKTLVTQGMFAHCRNPLYFGNLLIIAGIAVAANSIFFLMIGLPFFLFAYLAIIAAEENFLRGKFGPEYVEYCRKVNRLIPDFSGIRKTLQGMEFNWKRLIVKEYGTTFAWAAGMICIVTRNLWLNAGYEANRWAICTLAVLLGFLSLAYAVTRYLKKSGSLQAG